MKVAQLGPWNSPGQNTGMGSLSLLQGIFPTQGSNPGLSHCRQILYQLSHKGSPRILKWAVYPCSSGIEPRSPSLQVDSLPTELSGKPSPTIPRVNEDRDFKNSYTLLATMYIINNLFGKQFGFIL